MECFTPVQSETIDSTNPEYWQTLCNSPHDFQIVINKETLKGMISGFQNMENVACVQYFYQQIQKKFVSIDKAYQDRCAEHASLLQSSIDEYNTEKSLNQNVLNSYNEASRKNEMLREQMQQYQHQIRKLESTITSEQNKYYQHIEELKKRDSVVAEMANVVKKYNSMVDDYDKLYPSYEAYKTEYEKLKNGN
ncbi:Uncharacterized protein QTN25_000643 [Entamoeba marina]